MGKTRKSEGRLISQEGSLTRKGRSSPARSPELQGRGKTFRKVRIGERNEDHGWQPSKEGTVLPLSGGRGEELPERHKLLFICGDKLPLI